MQHYWRELRRRWKLPRDPHRLMSWTTCFSLRRGQMSHRCRRDQVAPLCRWARATVTARTDCSRRCHSHGLQPPPRLTLTAEDQRGCSFSGHLRGGKVQMRTLMDQTFFLRGKVFMAQKKRVGVNLTANDCEFWLISQAYVSSVHCSCTFDIE
jgi:hypothetical protein